MLTERDKEAIVVDPVFLGELFPKGSFGFVGCFGLYITEAV